MLSCCNCVLVCARGWVRRLCNTAILDLSLTDKFMSNLMYGLAPQNASKTPQNDKSGGTSYLSDLNELGTNEAPPDALPASSQSTDLSRGVSDIQKTYQVSVPLLRIHRRIFLGVGATRSEVL